MASAREERMQQRLRGAQRRQVKDVDFGLTFASVVAPVPPILNPTTATRRSPRRSQDLAPQLSPRPSPPNRGRSQPPSSITAEKRTLLLASHSSVDANTSAKRRKLDMDEQLSTVRSTRSSFPARQDIYTLEEDGQLDFQAADNTNGSLEQSIEIEQLAEPDSPTLFTPGTPRRTPTPAIGEEEITESPKHAPGSGYRTRSLNVSAMQQSHLQEELQSDSSVQVEPTGSPVPQRRRRDDVSVENIQTSTRPRRTRASKFNHSNSVNDSADEVDELSPELKRGRRRRASIQRESLEHKALTESEEGITAEEIGDEEVAALLNNVRVESRHTSAKSSPGLDEPSEQPSPSKRQHSPTSSPVLQSPPKKSDSRAAPKPSKAPKNQAARMGSPIPITTYRLTKRTPYDDDELNADILNSEIPYTNRPSVNVIDTLNTVCVEVIASCLGTLQDNARNTNDSALRREFRNKCWAVESYGRELQARLLEHTINLDNTFSLEKRVREEQRKRQALREEILRVRAEREQVALRMDEIRIRHETESKNAQNRDTLNNAVHDIELAVERGKEKNPRNPADGLVEVVGVELLLLRIASEVSNKSDTGGTLKQIKDFNAFLERTALALEGSKA